MIFSPLFRLRFGNFAARKIETLLSLATFRKHGSKNFHSFNMYEEKKTFFSKTHHPRAGVHMSFRRNNKKSFLPNPSLPCGTSRKWPPFSFYPAPFGWGPLGVPFQLLFFLLNSTFPAVLAPPPQCVLRTCVPVHLTFQ